MSGSGTVPRGPMPEALSHAKLTALLAAEHALVDEAIQVIHRGSETPMTLDLIELAGRGASPPLAPADALRGYLEHNGISDTFIAVMVTGADFRAIRLERLA
ncbi:hypothetical protein [Aquibium sp. ELW1220]|uniref:hypothetical protein n=1 Tax=Aquibium sp. ELW1220 TaxID=2976766 RepID=UPI0025AF860A|nr:hypothetical protein [Aquibium sp. ELW1220]MDN2584296.1 hypothetical protein [Aquibium sp. ELW1220]